MSEKNVMRVPVLMKILEERGMANKISKATGISSGNISDWKSGKSAPKPEALAKIAQFLNCTVDYLLGNTDNSQSLTDGLSGDEQRLITAYRELNDEGKNQADIYITEFLLQNARFTQKSDSDNAKQA